ncbi:MAG: hypothetical protein ACE5ID_03980 [Acidobacteriota bacterium]
MKRRLFSSGCAGLHEDTSSPDHMFWMSGASIQLPDSMTADARRGWTESSLPIPMARASASARSRILRILAARQPPRR